MLIFLYSRESVIIIKASSINAFKLKYLSRVTGDILN